MDLNAYPFFFHHNLSDFLFLFILAHSQKHPVYADSVESSSLPWVCVGNLLAASACYPAGNNTPIWTSVSLASSLIDFISLRTAGV